MDRVSLRNSGRTVRRFLPVLLLSAVAFTQLYAVWTDYGFTWLRAAWRTREMPAQTRGIRFMLGTRAADYVNFLQANVPENMKIVLPFGVGEFTQQSLMQFFLIPHPIPGCGCEALVFEEVTRECVLCLQKQDHAVPAIGPFPPVRAVKDEKIFIPNPTDTGWFHGVYLSELPSAPIQPAAKPPFISVAAIDTLLVFGLFFFGSLCVGTFLKEPGWSYLVPLALPLGMGLLTFSVFLIGWAGAPITRATFAVTYLGLVGFGILIRRRRWERWSPFPALRPSLSGSGSMSISKLTGLLVIAAIVLLVSGAIVISIGRVYTTVDGIANWAIKGYGIALEGSIFAGSNWGKHGLEYPQNIPLLTSLFRVVDGDALPGSKLIHPLLMGSMLAGSFTQWRRERVGLTSAALATLGLATIPILFLHATLGYANLPFTAYLVLGTLFMARGLVEDEPASSALGSLLLGFAAWTRPEGAAFGLLVLVALAVGSWVIGRRWVAGATAVVPFLAVSGIWLAFGSRYAAQGEIGQLLRAFVSAVLAGDIRVEPLTTLLAFAAGQIFIPGIWGLMVFAIPGFIGYGITKARPTRLLTGYLVGLAGLVCLLFAFGMFYIAGYTSGYGSGFLTDSFDRAMFPAVVLLFWAGVTLANSKPRHKGAGAA